MLVRLQTRLRLWRVVPQDPPTCHHRTWVAPGPQLLARKPIVALSGGHTLRRAAPPDWEGAGVEAGCSPQDSWRSGFGVGPPGLCGTFQERMAVRTFPPGRPLCASAHRRVPLHLAACLGIWKTGTKTSSLRNTMPSQAGRHCHPALWMRRWGHGAGAGLEDGKRLLAPPEAARGLLCQVFSKACPLRL